jgi:hypothetical protein
VSWGTWRMPGDTSVWKIRPVLGTGREIGRQPPVQERQVGAYDVPNDCFLWWLRPWVPTEQSGEFRADDVG